MHPYIIIFVVYILIFGNYFIYMLYYDASFLSLLIFNLNFILLNISYFRVQKLSPGYIPKEVLDHYDVDILKAQTVENTKILKKYRSKDKEVKIEQIIEIMQKPSWCNPCQNAKINRAHHCKECQKCIIRMDHHCPWVNNCVGRYNHKFFCLFLFYALACMGQIMIQMSVDLLGTREVYSKLNKHDKLWYTIGLTLTSGLNLSLGYLLIFHLYCISNNMTTLEWKNEGFKKLNPFRKSCLENMEEVFGIDLYQWLSPFKKVDEGNQYMYQFDNL